LKASFPNYSGEGRVKSSQGTEAVAAQDAGRLLIPAPVAWLLSREMLGGVQ